MRKIIFIIFCFGFFISCKTKQKQSINLKVMSYNIRHGLGLDEVLNLSRSGNIIKLEMPDLCALQEVDDFCLRSNIISQTDYLAEQTDMDGVFGKFMDFESGEYGMATLSRKPLISSKVLKLPDAIHEARSSIVNEVEISQGNSIVFANVHFEWIDGEKGNLRRLKQAKRLLNYIDSLNKPSIITGDFNCKPDSPTMKYFISEGFIFMEKGKDHLSFQGKNKKEIDHLIYRSTDNIKFKAKSIKLIKEAIVSDHRPLVAELEVIF